MSMYLAAPLSGTKIGADFAAKVATAKTPFDVYENLTIAQYQKAMEPLVQAVKPQLSNAGLIDITGMMNLPTATGLSSDLAIMPVNPLTGAQNFAIPEGINISDLNKILGLGGGNVATAGLSTLLTALAPALGQGLTAALGGTAATGTAGQLTGGQVVASGRGFIVVQTTSGKRVTIQRKKHSRRHYGGGGAKFSKLMEYALIRDMMRK